MKELLVTIIFIVALVAGVYWYAGHAVKAGKYEDADNNLIPDTWEEKFGWFFSFKGFILFILGLVVGYLAAVAFPM
jgi:hypothetical protein